MKRAKKLMLRLTTQNRAVLTGLPAEVIEALNHAPLTVVGNLKTTEAFVVLPKIPELRETIGMRVSGDGRLFIADGQARLSITEECELDYHLLPVGVAFTVKGRTPPSPEKLRHMLASPTRPVASRFAKDQPTLFEDLR